MSEASVAAKKCPRCQLTLPLEDFYMVLSRYDGRDVYCKECRSAAAAETRAKKTKSQPKGDEVVEMSNRAYAPDAEIAAANRQAYRQRKRRPCAFPGCDTNLRYRSKYAPYCDRHGTKDRRAEALA